MRKRAERFAREQFIEATTRELELDPPGANECHDLCPRVLPAGWVLASVAEDGAKYVHVRGLTVIISMAKEQDGCRWLHVSCSKAHRLPTWLELREVKDLFIGKKKKAVQVLPSEDEYVNIHPFVLHMWHCLDKDPLPDFTRGLGTL